MIAALYQRWLQEANAARAAGDPEGAERLYRAAAGAAPRAGEPHHHLAVLLEAQGRLDEAQSEYRAALRLAPGAAGTQRLLGRLLLSLGRYSEGFALMEARHALPDIAKPPLPFPEWRGEDLTGKRLLIWPEQGLGDQIQFARFAPLLQAGGADVTLICLPALTRLFSGCLGVRTLSASGCVEFPDPDYWIMTCSLAWRMNLEPASIPTQPYLHALERPHRSRAGGIGVVTQGNPRNINDANRSLDADSRAALMQLIPGAIDLDPAATGARDFADTAAIIQDLDLVICVDTAVAHLAGAMGKACWVLIPAVGTDWRWGWEALTTPWYPSVRLYRQAPGGAWADVFGRIEADLHRDQLSSSRPSHSR